MSLLDGFVDGTPTLAHLFHNTVANFGERPAQMFKANGTYQTYSYNQFAQVVEEMASGLMAIGIQPGDNVCLMARTAADWGWADFSILTSGGVTVCVYPTLTSEELIFIANHATARFLVAGDAEVLERVIPALPQLKTVEKVIVLQAGAGGDNSSVVDINNLRAMGRDYAAQNPGAFTKRWQSLNQESPATVIYTSGTTGGLKGSLFTHGDMVGALARSLKHMEIGGYALNYEGVAFSLLPLAHVWERNNSYLAIIACGACTGYCEKPTTLLQDIQAIKPTWTLLVPRLWDRIMAGIKGMLTSTPEGKKKFDEAMAVGYEVLEKRTQSNGTVDLTADPTLGLNPELKARFEKADAEVFSVLRNALGGRLNIPYSGGALLPADLHRSYLAMNFPLLNGWGLTETAAGINHGYPNATKIGWLSKMVPGVEARLDVDGEILVRGVGVIKEYYRNPEDTADSFTPDGWFRTGDIGEFDEEGFLRIVDRKKYIIVLDTGKKVAPARIESRFTGNPIIEQVVIAGDGRKYITALLAPAYDYILYLFSQKGIEVDQTKLEYANINGINTCIQVGADVARHPLLQELVKQEIDKVNAGLDDFETIKRFYILPRKLTEASGEMTPTLKIKNRVVFTNFNHELEDLYA